MSSYLSWREHMKNILSRAYKTLNLIRYSFTSGHSPQTKKILYLPLVHSQLRYCSQIWHPHLLKDVIILEKIQQHLKWLHIWLQISLKILPLMMQLELYDVMFFIRSLKGPADAFNIDDHGSTRSSTHLKLKHVLSRTNSARDIFTST